MIDAFVAWFIVTTGILGHPVGPGVWQNELRMAGRGPLSVVRVQVIRIDPARVSFMLDTATRDMGTRADWTIDQLPANGLLAFNGGQFIGGVTSRHPVVSGAAHGRWRDSRAIAHPGSWR